MNFDGSEQVVVAPPDPQSFAHVADFDWSPDGTEIAFLDGGSLRIHSFLDASQREVLSNVYANYLDWAPNGEWIVLAVHHPSPLGLYLVRPDGTDLHHIGPDASATEPRWSPDGTRVAATFFHSPGGTNTVDVVSVDGTSKRVATDTYYGPTWSPDSTRLAYVDTNGQLSVVRTDAPNTLPVSISKITAPQTASGQPSWSVKDKIAYTSGGGLKAVNPDGSGQMTILEHGFGPQWDPTGEWLLGMIGDDIYRVSDEGTEPTNLTNTEDRYDSRPRWSLDGTRIAFVSSAKPIIPPDETIARTVTLGERRHLVLRGRVSDAGEPSASCGYLTAKVVLQRWEEGEWRTVGHATTEYDNGRFRAKVTDRPGRYRALVRRSVFYHPSGGKVICLAAHSPTAIHRH